MNKCLCWLNCFIYIAVDREVLRANPIDKKPVFPLPIRDILWYEIHSVGVALEFKENLSHHMVHHSFGTLMLSARIPIESISKMMGHTNTSATQVYAKVTDQKISEDMDKLMKYGKKLINSW